MVLVHALRRATMLKLLPVTLALAYLFSHDRPDQWNTYWLAASAHVTAAVVFLGPLAAGAAAWDARRFQRLGMEDLGATSSRPVVVRTVVDVVPTLVWAAVPYGVVLALQWWQMLPEAGGGPSLQVLGLGFALISVDALIGAVAGS
ncbi:hypothetical protein B7486_60920, partial [cyanobacterium TDX16]